MKKSTIRVLLLIIIYGMMSVSLLAQNHPIYVGNTLSPGYDMGVNSGDNQTNWLSDSSGYMKMEYPAGQNWGAVFITVGPPVSPPRPFRNFSMYRSISLEMKGARGGESVEIGIKDNTDPDNGQETRISITLTNQWQVYEIELNRFVSADLTHLYIPVEFIFGGNQSKTVYFRNIVYNQ